MPTKSIEEKSEKKNTLNASNCVRKSRFSGGRIEALNPRDLIRT